MKTTLRQKKTIEFLIEEFTQKVTHLTADLWAIVCGGVHSGALHTSHMDSWLLLFLFVMFCLTKAEDYPQYASQIETALMTKLIAIVVYGDDNWYFLPRGPLSELLNAHQFAKWLDEYIGMELRDIRVGHSLVSVPKNGFFSLKGGVYLRHYCVENHVKREGQPKYLPYRPMKEIVLKTIYGREPKTRGPANLLLSAIGHAYGTYGSNPFTYNWLWSLYQSVLLITDKPAEYFLKPDTHPERDLVRKMRQLNITMEQLMKGFPTQELLEDMNTYDPSYHDKFSMSVRAMMST